MSLVVRKPAFCICENKDADQLRGNREADQRPCFATQIQQTLYFLNSKFQASSHLLWLYSLVYVRPGRKPRRPVFSQRGSYILARQRTTKSKISFRGRAADTRVCCLQRWLTHQAAHIKAGLYIFIQYHHNGVVPKSLLKLSLELTCAENTNLWAY